ncbi:hypothetical protein NUM3379_17390 [Kineococcus sp. NUM-3379]
MRELATEGIPVALTCRVLEIARQHYYRWLLQPVTPAELEEACRAGALHDAHREDPELGYRYLHEEAAEAGQVMAERTAWRICADNGWWIAFAKRRNENGKRPGPPVHDDLVERNFTAEAPNRLWPTDITEHKTSEGKLYLCAIKDACSRRIVGYSIDSTMKSRLAVTALSNAVARRRAEGVEVAGCVVHSDRGSQYRSRKYVHALGRYGLVGSMGRVGAAGDNAAMEGFSALLQNNVLDRQSWATREELRIAIVTWTERTISARDILRFSDMVRSRSSGQVVDAARFVGTSGGGFRTELSGIGRAAVTAVSVVAPSCRTVAGQVEQGSAVRGRSG